MDSSRSAAEPSLADQTPLLLQPIRFFAMLRYFAYSVRNLHAVPDYSDSRPNWEFWISLRGEARPLFHTDEPVGVARGNFWIMPPQVRYHWVSSSPEVERVVVHFAFVAVELETIVRRHGFHCRTLDKAELDEVRHIARQLERQQRRRDALNGLHAQRAMIDLCLLALRDEPALASSTLETQAGDRAQAAVAWYMEHVYEAPKLARVAAEMHVSTSHLRRLFRNHFGKSPREVLDTARLQRAVTLLSAGTAKLDDVARRTGFHSTPDFCRVFKKHLGCSPNVWRHSVNRVNLELLPHGRKAMRVVFNPGDRGLHSRAQYAAIGG